jgi:hypothetical protein
MPGDKRRTRLLLPQLLPHALDGQSNEARSPSPLTCMMAGGVCSGTAACVPVASLPAAETAAHFGWLAHFAMIDCPASAAWTRERLDWHPGQLGLIADRQGAAYGAG